MSAAHARTRNDAARVTWARPRRQHGSHCEGDAVAHPERERQDQHQPIDSRARPHRTATIRSRRRRAIHLRTENLRFTPASRRRSLRSRSLATAGSSAPCHLGHLHGWVRARSASRRAVARSPTAYLNDTSRASRAVDRGWIAFRSREPPAAEVPRRSMTDRSGTTEGSAAPESVRHVSGGCVVCASTGGGARLVWGRREGPSRPGSEAPARNQANTDHGRQGRRTRRRAPHQARLATAVALTNESLRGSPPWRREG